MKRLQKEQKQAQTSEEKEYIRTIKSIISDFIRDKKPENLAYYQRIYDWLDGRPVPFSCGHENDKPADPVFSKQEYESHPIISTDTTSAKPADLDGKALLYTADKSYQIGFRDGVASVKQEWSEEDERMLRTIISDGSRGVELDSRQIAWLKSLRPSWKPSEEQMDTLKNVAYGTYQNGDGPALRELYEQLVKNYKL